MNEEDRFMEALFLRVMLEERPSAPTFLTVILEDKSDEDDLRIVKEEDIV